MERDFSRVTEAQRICLRKVLSRRNSKEIALELGISHHTVDKRLERALRTLGAGTRFEAARLLADHEGATYERLVSEPIDIDPAAGSDTLDPSFNERVDTRRPERNVVREERQPFEAVFERSHSRSFRLPIRMGRGTINDLTVKQRLGWMLALPLAFAMAFGMLAIGLRTLLELAQAIVRVVR
jgi:DNA-binding CsgD family transcriptional regulator